MREKRNNQSSEGNVNQYYIIQFDRLILFQYAWNLRLFKEFIQLKYEKVWRKIINKFLYHEIVLNNVAKCIRKAKIHTAIENHVFRNKIKLFPSTFQ